LMPGRFFWRALNKKNAQDTLTHDQTWLALNSNGS
jgi:hypothetical protein